MLTCVVSHLSTISSYTYWAYRHLQHSALVGTAIRATPGSILSSVTRMGYFWKVLTKVTEKFLQTFLGIFVKHNIWNKDCGGVPYITTSGHTDPQWRNKSQLGWNSKSSIYVQKLYFGLIDVFSQRYAHHESR